MMKLSIPPGLIPGLVLTVLRGGRPWCELLCVGWNLLNLSSVAEPEQWWQSASSNHSTAGAAGAQAWRGIPLWNTSRHLTVVC